MSRILERIVADMKPALEAAKRNVPFPEMKKRAEKCAGLEELMSMLPTKKYTLARLRREILAWLFSVSEDDKNSIPGYTVLLAANKKAQVPRPA